MNSKLCREVVNLWKVLICLPHGRAQIQTKNTDLLQTCAMSSCLSIMDLYYAAPLTKQNGKVHQLGQHHMRHRIYVTLAEYTSVSQR